jgi:hypothetical protein
VTPVPSAPAVPSEGVGSSVGVEASADDDAEHGDLAADAGDGDAGDGEAGDDDYSALPHSYATDVLEPLPRPEVASGAHASGMDDSEEDSIEAGHDGSANADPDDSATGLLKRARATRNSPIPRLSRTKRPGAPSQPAGN